MWRIVMQSHLRPISAVLVSTKSLRVVIGVVATLVLAGMLSLPAWAQPDMCAGGILDQGAALGTEGPDLVITNMTCTVDGTKSPYNFHNVYIFGNGTLTFDNVTMSFYAANILVQNQGLLSAMGIGANNGGQTLTIHLYGSATDAGVTCKKMEGNMVVDDPTCGIPTSDPDVWDSNMPTMQYPTTACTKTSQLNPPTLLPGGVDDCFYQYQTLDSNDVNGA
jgi:hypothetical protein